jgi:hypothetical protein
MERHLPVVPLQREMGASSMEPIPLKGSSTGVYRILVPKFTQKIPGDVVDSSVTLL